MQRHYVDDFRGWPVAPKNRQHPVRGSFLDPRPGTDALGRPAPEYHHGIDISLRDDRPEANAPAGAAYRVFALEGGEAWGVVHPRRLGKGGQVRVGHFGYGHVLPIVSNGQRVRAGQQIAWTARGFWHLHLSEWLLPEGIPRGPIDPRHRLRLMIPVNPLDRDGKIAPYVDTAPPLVHPLRFFSPVASAWRIRGLASFPPAGILLDANHLRGQVDVRARIEDPQSFLGWWRDLPTLEVHHHPQRVHVHVMRFADGKVVIDRDVFDADLTLAPGGPRGVDFSEHFAPGTRQNRRAPQVVRSGRHGRGQLWFRPLARKGKPFWDTTRLANGRYRITVTAWDVAGNRGQRSGDCVIEN